MRFKDKYRPESTRLKGYDYSSPGWYFVTICTKDRVCCLGEVADASVHLTPIGDIVREEWTRTPIIRANVELDAWVIMPNHVHGIIVITNTPATPNGMERFHEPHPVSDESGVMERGVPRRNVSTIPGDTETFRRNVSTKASRLKPGSLGSLIGQIKSISTKRTRAAGFGDFDWQERFYDEIIRDEKALNRIRQYIMNNPANWQEDKDNPANVWM